LAVQEKINPVTGNFLSGFGRNQNGRLTASRDDPC
jgi:hypothetical protein